MLGEVIETRVRVDDPDLPELAGIDVVVVDLGIEQTRTRDWVVTKVAVRPQRRLGRRSNVYIAGWLQVQGLTPSGLAMPTGCGSVAEQFEGQRLSRSPALRELPGSALRGGRGTRRRAARRRAAGRAEGEQVRSAGGWGRARGRCARGDGSTTPPTAGDVDPADAEQFPRRMDPEVSRTRRLLVARPTPRAATIRPVVRPPNPPSPGAARVRDPDLTPRRVAGVQTRRRRPPTGRYLGCVHLQRCANLPPSLSAASTKICRPWVPDPLAAVTLLRCLQSLYVLLSTRKPPTGRGVRRRRPRPLASRRLAGRRNLSCPAPVTRATRQRVSG